MSLKERINLVKEQLGINEVDTQALEKALGKKLVDYESIDALVAALMGYYNEELKKKQDTGNYVSSERKVIAGNGLDGGGALSKDITINIVTTDDSLTVDTDSIKVNTYDGVDNSSTTRPASANAVKTAYDKANTMLPKSGNNTYNGNLTVTGTGVFNGHLTSQDEVTAFSDRALKSEIKVIDKAIDKVKKITGYTYKMLGADRRQAGVIAQEVKEVLPEVVVENDCGYLSVAYGNISALLVQAIKEMDDRLRKVEDRLGGDMK